MITNYLCCFACGGPLHDGGDSLQCPSCLFSFPVIAGIPRFAPGDDTDFSLRWRNHPAPQAQIENQFWPKTGWTPADLTGKVILDAGCGIGRFSDLVARHGAVPLAVDLSPTAAETAARNVPAAMVAQADLLALPVADSSVDAAFSIGVLHHTADPRAAFERVARTVKPGGQLAVWLYEKPPEQVAAAMELLHAITRACPPDALYSATQEHAVRVRDLYGGAWGPLQQVLRVSTSRDDDECVSDTFDWHCPRYRSWHTAEEVVGWFEACGYRVDRIGPPNVNVSVRGVRL